jgi:hypothetical protein
MARAGSLNRATGALEKNLCIPEIFLKDTLLTVCIFDRKILRILCVLSFLFIMLGNSFCDPAGPAGSGSGDPVRIFRKNPEKPRFLNSALK